VNEPFNAWAQGAWYYGPLFAAGLVFFLMGVAVLLFFRDFPREITAGPNEITSAADGTVVAIEDLEETEHYDGPARRLSVFMSVFSAHVNRAPYEGVVREVRHAPGKYINAMKEESSKVNESNAVWMDTEKGLITFRQIAGAVARRIVCPAKAGMHLVKGEKYGMIRFGSRMELYLPPGTEISVKPGDRVYAGTTVVARF